MEDSTSLSNKSKSWFLLVILAVIWGSSFILMKKSMFDENHNELLTANEVASLRIFISSVVLFFVAVRKWKIALSKDWIFLILVGLLGNLIPAFLFTNAEKTLSSSSTGILNSLVPLFSVLVAAFVFGQKISFKAFLGVLIGLSGTVFLILFNSPTINSIPLYPSLMVVFATVCYAFSLNIIKNKLHHVSSITITAISLAFMLPFCAIHLIGFTDVATKIGNPMYSQAFVLTSILAVFGTTFALIIFNQLIKLTTSVFASSVTYFIPVVAILWGVYFGENITWAIGFSGLILVGVFIVKKEEQKRISKKTIS